MAGERAGAPGIVVREATAADNEALITLELESPLVVGNIEETFDRSPDFFACHRHKGEFRVVIAEMGGRIAGVMAGVIQNPTIQGKRRRIMYVQQARVHPDFRGRRVAWSLANDLFAWASKLGAEGPYYLILPENEQSLAFVARGGGRWPIDVSLLSFDVEDVKTERAERLTEGRLAESAALINETHAAEDFFEPLAVKALAERLRRDRLYSIDNMYGVLDDGNLVAVGGLWDKGATTEQIHRDRASGETTRSRSASVADWGFAPGREAAFAELLRGLAGEAHRLGRTALSISEAAPGAVPDPGLRAHRTAVALFTPTVQPPPTASIRGLYVDMLYV